METSKPRFATPSGQGFRPTLTHYKKTLQPGNNTLDLKDGIYAGFRVCQKDHAPMTGSVPFEKLNNY